MSSGRLWWFVFIPKWIEKAYYSAYQEGKEFRDFTLPGNPAQGIGDICEVTQEQSEGRNTTKEKQTTETNKNTENY